jgi:endoglucanase
MKNKNFTIKDEILCQTKTSRTMRIMVPVMFALILQTLTNFSYAKTTSDTIDFEIYYDVIEDGVQDATSSEGTIDFYSQDTPYEGSYCLLWSGIVQYGAITLKFDPTKDLSVQYDSSYGLDMYIRGTATEAYAFDIRFLDTDTGDDDHPWRIKTKIDTSVVEWNGEWQHLHIPLNEFIEGGSWDGSWFNPEGLFDWSAIDKLEFVNEYDDMPEDAAISFDKIQIVKEGSDVNDDSTSGITVTDKQAQFISLNYGYNQQILLKNEIESEAYLSLINISGRIILSDRFDDQYVIDGANLEKGIYIIQVHNNKNDYLIKKISIR